MGGLANTIGNLTDLTFPGLGSTVKKGVNKLLPGPPDMPAPPTLKPVTSMPTADDDSVRRAKRRSLAEQLQRRGSRESTILTDTLG